MLSAGIASGAEEKPAVFSVLDFGAVKSGLVRGNVIECAAAEAITVTRSSGMVVEENEVTRWEP